MKHKLLKFGAAIIITGVMLVLAPVANILMMGEAQAQTSGQGQLVTDFELKVVGDNGHTQDGCRSVTFIFRSSYTGNIGGIAFTSSDVPLTIRAENGNVLRQIPFTITAGTLGVISTH